MKVSYCPSCSGKMVERLIDAKPRPVCNDCGFIFFQGPKVAVAVVIIDGGEVLLTKRNIAPQKGQWSFISGYVDLGESVEEAAVREVQEETGVTVRLDGLVGVYSEANDSVVLVVYAGTIIGGEVVIGHEAQDVRLFGLDQLPELAFTHDQQILDDALAMRQGLGLR